MKHKVTEVIFSPGGSAERISGMFRAFAGWEGTEKINLLNRHESASRTFQPDEVAIVAAPVFFGRIPEIVSQKLHEIKGTGTPAVAMVVYGNRDYEDALLELTDILTAVGFVVFGVGAFIARHSIFPLIAKGGPTKRIRKFFAPLPKGARRRSNEPRRRSCILRAAGFIASTAPFPSTPKAQGAAQAAAYAQKPAPCRP